MWGIYKQFRFRSANKVTQSDKGFPLQFKALDAFFKPKCADIFLFLHDNICSEYLLEAPH